MKFQPMLVGKMEDADDVDRVSFEDVGISNVDAMIFGDKISTG